MPLNTNGLAFITKVLLDREDLDIEMLKRHLKKTDMKTILQINGMNTGTRISKNELAEILMQYVMHTRQEAN